MEGAWRSERAFQHDINVSKQRRKSRRINALNPFTWQKSTVKLFFSIFISVMAPIYAFIGLQPSAIVDAANYPTLTIDAINLSTPVVGLELSDRQLIAPAKIAGSYSQAPNKVFIIGHSTTVFDRLDKVRVTDTITYDGKNYTITEITTLLKSNVNMGEILAAGEEDTIVIMTCAGEPLPNQDATHRLIITATLTDKT